MNRIMWKHESTADYRSELGHGIRPTMETRYPEGMILLSELGRAKLAARRAYARWHDVPVSTVTAKPIYAPGMASVDHVVAYVADPDAMGPGPFTPPGPLFLDTLTDDNGAAYWYGHCYADSEADDEIGCGMEYAYYPSAQRLDYWHDAVGQVSTREGFTPQDVTELVSEHAPHVA